MPALVAAEKEAVGPVVDGRLLTGPLAQAFARGDAAPIPLLIGSNTGEDNLLGKSDPRWVLRSLTPAQVAEVRGAYGLVPGDDAALARLVFRDSVYGAPTRWVARRQSARAPTFLYRFGYVPTLERLKMSRAPHASEIPYVFDAMDRTPIPVARLFLPWDGAEMTRVHGCWTTFVKSGRPVCPRSPPWDAYNPRLDWVMAFDRDVTSVEPDSLGHPLDLIERLFRPAAAPPAS